MSDVEKVKKLREATGAGFKDCNLAIKESGGDLDKAIEILREKTDAIKVISNDVGFKDTAYFCRRFKMMFGVQAGKMKKRLNEI